MPKRPRPKRPPRIDVSHHEVQSPRVQVGLDGLRLAHLSDIHVRSGLRPRRLLHAVELIEALRPDLVLLTGDFVCFSPRPLPALTEALRRLTLPTFAVLGNHDHWSGAAAVRKALEKAGVDVLCNDHRVLSLRSGTLHLIGLDDPVTKKHDPVRAFTGVPREATRLVLSHCPGGADVVSPFEPALILSGHTHGGQVHVPRVTPFVSSRIGVKYLKGFFQVEGSVLFVNRGLGESLPLRIGSAPELANLTLRSAPAVAVRATGGAHPAVASAA